MKYAIGRKVGMTQVFSENGNLIPVSVIEFEPQVIVQKKTTENDGYEAIQVGFGDIKAKNVRKPRQGHFGKAGVEPKKYLREIKVESTEEYNIGDNYDPNVFEAGEFVDITGTSKGKGTQGMVKRHNFQRGRETHGSKMHRTAGGMGAASYPARVWKNHRMAGKMGNKRVTVQNLEVIRVDNENNFMLVKGAIPGPKKGLVYVKETVKK